MDSFVPHDDNVTSVDYPTNLLKTKEEKKKTGVSLKIHHKILMMNLALAFVPLILAGILAYNIGMSTLHEVIGQTLQQNAVYITDSLDRDLFERIRSQRSWANLRMMQDVAKGDSDGKISSLLSSVYENNSSLYKDLVCVNTEGIIIAASNPARVGLAVSEESWFQKGIQEGISFVGSVHDLDNKNNDLIGIAQPIRTYPDRQRIIGILTSMLNWESFTGTTEFFNKEQGGTWDSGLLSIIDRKGNVLFQSTPSHESNQTKEKQPLPGDLPSVQKALTGESGSVMEHGINRNKMLSGFSHSSGYMDFKGLGWSAILSVPHTVAFEPVYRMGKILGIVGLLCLILIPVIASLFSRGITRPLTRMIEILKDLAEGEGDLTRRIEVESNDEIKDLTVWMNTFIQNIQEIVRQIKETMINVSLSSNQISESTDNVSTGTDEQGNAIQEISRFMEAMDAMNRKISENAGNLALHTEEVSSSIMEMSASIDEVAENSIHSSASVDETSSSITEMVTSINEISTNIDSLSANVDETAKSIDEIDHSIQEVEKNAKNSLEISKDAVDKAEGGTTAVLQAQEGMGKIKETFEDSAQVIKRLGEKSVEIGTILKVIDEVAEQTNLLALNAAIIAAQAGEHGKGFAVVADEIKDLAERSAASSSEIGEVIRSVQKETSDAVQSMEVSSSSITLGMDLSVQSGEALKEIKKSVDRSRRMIEEIAQATVDQSKESQQVKKAVEKITNSLKQIVKGTQEQQNGSSQIMENTEQIRGSISHVSRAMQEQAKGSGQISKAIEEINFKTQEISKSTGGQSQKTQEVLSNSKKIEQIAGKNSQQVHEMITATSEMAEKVKRLEKEINKFKV